MKERVKEFLSSKGLNARQLAELIDVQPSSISHLLTGRNKPSVELLQKLLEKFPDLDIFYLLTGNKKVVSNVPGNDSDAQSDYSINIPDEEDVEETGFKDPASRQKAAARVIIFHSDGTFDEFLPT